MTAILSRLRLGLALGTLSCAVLGSLALAQPPAFVRVAGVVSAAAADSVTVKAPDGTVTVLPLDSAWTVVVTRPVDIEAIKPGSFVATANDNVGANEGKSIELRIFEPGSRLGEGSRPMTAGRTMTNGTVTTVTKGAGGRALDVSYPGGVRHIVVPPDVQVIGSFPVARDRVKPGVTITAIGLKGDDGVTRGTRVQIVEPAAKP